MVGEEPLAIKDTKVAGEGKPVISEKGAWSSQRIGSRTGTRERIACSFQQLSDAETDPEIARSTTTTREKSFANGSRGAWCGGRRKGRKHVDLARTGGFRDPDDAEKMPRSTVRCQIRRRWFHSGSSAISGEVSRVWVEIFFKETSLLPRIPSTSIVKLKWTFRDVQFCRQRTRDIVPRDYYAVIIIVCVRASIDRALIVRFFFPFVRCKNIYIRIGGSFSRWHHADRQRRLGLTINAG